MSIDEKKTFSVLSFSVVSLYEKKGLIPKVEYGGGSAQVLKENLLFACHFSSSFLTKTGEC